MIEKNEVMKQLIEMAILSGRKRKSVQTGYVHHFHGGQDSEPQQSIPLIENFLYAYALLRARTIESVNEAKGILDGLLYFQNGHSRDISFGNFPIYLHDYPVCKDRFTGVHVGMVLCLILKQFHQILGQDLKSRLEKSLGLVVDHIFPARDEKERSYVLDIKLGVLFFAAGEILQNPKVAEKGNAILEEKSFQSDEALNKEEAWYCPESLGEIAVALSLVYPSLKDCPFIGFWQHLTATWHKETASYIGPSLKEWQYAEEPQVTIYDYLMGYFSGAFSARAKKDQLVQLKCVLIQLSEDVIAETELPATYKGNYKDAKWVIYNAGRFAYSCIDEGSFEVNPVYAKGYYPFKLLFGDLQRAHTFACQNGNAKTITFEPCGNEISIDYQLGHLIEFEDRENSREVAFFIDIQDSSSFDVEGEKSSTFILEELLTLSFSNLKLELKFDVSDVEVKKLGRFLGHRMLGNRPAQIAAKGMQRYNAYDWQVFLRTVRRPEECRVKVFLKIIS